MDENVQSLMYHFYYFIHERVFAPGAFGGIERIVIYYHSHIRHGHTEKVTFGL